MSHQRSEGPKIEIHGTCMPCRHLQSTYYRVQGDSGFDYHCADQLRDIGSTSTTPVWCPFFQAAVESALALKIKPNEENAK